MQAQSSHFAIGFDPETGGVADLTTADGHRYIRQAQARPLLWRLVLRGTDTGEVVVDNTAAAPSFQQRAGGLAVTWAPIDLPGEPRALEVRATCNLARTSATARLRLWVRNRSRAMGLWNVQFPVLGPLSAPGQCDVAVGRGNWGELYRAAEEEISGTYPSYNLPMQFMLLGEGDHGLYLAAHDPRAMHKEFHLTPGGEFRTTTWAEGMGVPGAGWSAPYAFALGVYRGDWMAGCKRYRAWALRSAPWTRRGPLTGRPDVPESLRMVCAWFRGQGTRGEAAPVVRQYAAAVGAPTAVHWYNWHEVPFDTRYPDYFPTKPGFADGVAELRRAGVVVMPYINARLWDSGNANFPPARPHTVKDEQGGTTIEEYGSGAKLAVMCPSQPYWHEKVRGIVQRLVAECGVDSVYLDQIGSAPPRLCFDPSHGHPLGGGSWWVDGYRRMLEPMKRWCTSDGRQVSLTTENDAEPYMDTVDGFLVWTPRDAHEVPMTAAVYSGYTLYFASNRAFAGGDTAFCVCQARDFTWGTQLGWEEAEITQPEHAAKLAYQARLARLRALALDYVVYGELLEVLPLHGDPGQLTGTWNTWQGDRTVTLPGVHAALWRGRDGTAAVLLANADTAARTVCCVVDAARHRVGRRSQQRVRVLGVDTEVDLGCRAGRRIELTVEVPGRDGLIVRLGEPTD